MNERTYLDTETTHSVDLEALGKGLMVLAIGALLGLAVVIPYDRLLGLPGPTGSILGATVWVALLGWQQLLSREARFA